MQLPTAHTFIAASLDGFIAQSQGSVDWLLSHDDPTEVEAKCLERP